MAQISGEETTGDSFDIVVVGGGGAGLPTALFSSWLGDSVCGPVVRRLARSSP